MLVIYPNFLQRMLDTIQSKAWNQHKSSVIKSATKDSKKQESNRKFILEVSPLKYNFEITLVGIKINSDMTNKPTIESEIQKKLESFYSPMDINQKTKTATSQNKEGSFHFACHEIHVFSLLKNLKVIKKIPREP